MKPSYKKEATSGIKWTTLATLITAGGSFLLILYLTKVLSKTDFGLFALVNVVSVFSAEFVDMGIGQAIIQKKEVSSKQLSSLFWVNIFLGVIVFAVVFFSSGLIAQFYESVDLEPLLQWTSIGFLIGATGAQFQALFQKELLFKRIAAIEVIAFIGYCVTVLYFAFNGYGVYALVWGGLARVAIKVLLSIALGWKLHIPRFHYNTHEIKSFLSFGSFRTGAFVVGFLASQLDAILIGKFIGVAELGIYDVLKRLAIYPVKMITPVIQKVLYPILAKVHESKERASAMFQKALELLNLIRFPIFIGIALCAQPITQFLDPAWAQEFQLLQLLCVLYLFQTIQSFVGQSMIAMGKSHWGFYNSLVVLPLNLIAIYVGSSWGIYGIVIAMLGLAFLMIVPRYLIIIKQLFHMPFSSYLSVVFKGFFLIGILAVIIYFGMEYLELPFWGDLVLRSSLFLLGTLGIYSLFEKEKLTYLKSIVK